MQIITLRDRPSGTVANILPGLGFNCFRFGREMDGQSIDWLWAEAEFETGERRPSGSGIPILFPFPGRMQGARFEYDGRTFDLEPRDGRGNAIHGFVLDRPWNVIEQTETKAVGQFHAARDAPGVLDSWPADFGIRVTYEVSARTLRMEVVVDNPGERTLPWGLGLHPYFRVPPADGKSADTGGEDYRVTVPAATWCELSEMLPTGKRFPAEGARHLAAGLPFAETGFDDVFTDLTFERGVCTCTIASPSGRGSLRVTFDDLFDHCVVYNPPHRQAICIEPYTCLPGAFGDGAAQGIDEALALLDPGDSRRGTMTLAFDG